MPVYHSNMQDSQWDSTALYDIHPALPCKYSNFWLLSRVLSDWLIASFLYLQHLLLTMTHWVTFNNNLPLTKECRLTLLYDLYCCQYTVNGFFFVNIPHYFFAKRHRLQREKTKVPCKSGWHSTPLGPTSLCVDWMMTLKDIIWLQVAMLQYISHMLIFTKSLVPRTSLPTVIATAIQATVYTGSNVHKASSIDSPSKRWQIILATAMYVIEESTILELLSWLLTTTYQATT